MSKKHFESIASTFRFRLNAENRSELYALARDLCDTFQQTNERFDRNRFMSACGF